jgi:hypothetical protein
LGDPFRGSGLRFVVPPSAGLQNAAAPAEASTALIALRRVRQLWPGGKMLARELIVWSPFGPRSEEIETFMAQIISYFKCLI